MPSECFGIGELPPKTYFAAQRRGWRQTTIHEGKNTILEKPNVRVESMSTILEKPSVRVERMSAILEKLSDLGEKLFESCHPFSLGITNSLRCSIYGMAMTSMVCVGETSTANLERVRSRGTAFVVGIFILERVSVRGSESVRE